MAKILITSGPTRQYLDPVRYLTNASSGRMGAALATAAVEAGHQVVVVSGPVEVIYPTAAEVHWIVSTEEMLQTSQELFPQCDGVIGAAAPCDYKPVKIESQKINKNGDPLTLNLLETDDVIATLAASKTPQQWSVGFALETEDHRLRALAKLERKSCDLMVLNDASAMNATENQVEIINHTGEVLQAIAGSKLTVARTIIATINDLLIA